MYVYMILYILYIKLKKIKILISFSKFEIYRFGCRTAISQVKEPNT